MNFDPVGERHAAKKEEKLGMSKMCCDRLAWLAESSRDRAQRERRPVGNNNRQIAHARRVREGVTENFTLEEYRLKKLEKSCCNAISYEVLRGLSSSRPEITSSLPA